MPATLAFNPAVAVSTFGAKLPFLLVHSFLDNSSGKDVLKVRPLANQPLFEGQLPGKVDDMILTLSMSDFTRGPGGAFVITDDYTFLTPMSVHINTFKIMAAKSGSPITVSGGMSEQMEKRIDYLISYLHTSTNPEYGEEFAENMANSFGAWGYTPDWVELLAVPATAADPDPFGLDPIDPMVVTNGGYVTTASGVLAELLEKYPCPDESKYGFFVDPKIWAVLVRNRYKRKNVMLTGPSGVGKTQIAKILAAEFGQSLHTVDMGTVQDAQSAMIGVHRLDHEQKSIFDPAPFVHYIQSGEVVLVDEVNRGPLSSQNLLFPCLDSRRYLPVDIAGEGEERHIKVHEQTFFIGTANLGAEYGGTQSLDWAFKQRFHIVELGYLKPADEIRMLVLRTGIEQKYATTIVKLADWTRQEVKDQGLEVAISTRETIDTAEMVFDGFTLHEAIESVIFPMYDNDGAEREKVRTQLAQY